MLEFTRVLLAFVLLVASLTASAAPSRFVLSNVHVVNVNTGEIHAAQYILVEEGTIAAVGDASEVAVPEDVPRIDGHGRHAIPGLWDMHVHAMWSNRYEAALPLFVAHGVTGIRDMWGDIAVAQGVRTSGDVHPAIHLAGNLIDGDDPVWPGSNSVGTADEARVLVDALVKEGSDFLKVYSRLSRSAYFAIAERAQMLGVPFAGHVPASITTAEAANAGQRSMEHLTGVLIDCTRNPDALRHARPRTAGEIRLYRQALIEEFDSTRCRDLARTLAAHHSWQVPTLVSGSTAAVDAAAVFDESPQILTMHPEEHAWWARAARQVRNQAEERGRYRAHAIRVTAILHDAGVPLLAGTDTFNPFAGFGSALHGELEALVEAGLTPLEALRTATVEPARYLGVHDRLGTIERGKSADIVLLDGSPLADIRNTRSVAAVVLRGQYLSRETLHALKERAYAVHYGAALRMIDPFAGIPSVAIRSWTSFELIEKELQRYEGTYDLNGAMVRIWLEGSQLHMSNDDNHVPGVVSLHLVPQGNDLFSRGLYQNGELRRVFWPEEWLRFIEADGRYRRIEIVPVVDLH